MYSPKALQLLLILTLLLVPSLTTGPASYCLGNCINCAVNTPNKCLPATNASTGITYQCLPFYDGNNCNSSVPGRYTLVSEKGPFFSWTPPTAVPQRNCTLRAPASGQVSSIGPFSSQLSATKTLQFNAQQRVNRVQVKIVVAVSDALLFTISNSSVVNVTVRNDDMGNTIITTIESALKNTLPQPVQLLTLSATSNGSVIFSGKAQYQARSGVQTSCGFVYQYQWTITSQTPLTQLILNFQQTASNNAVWNLLDFQASVGCSGFTVGGQCNNCLSGYYQYQGPSKELYGCNPCNYTCSTCSSSSCLLCEAYTISRNFGDCAYPDTYKTYRQFKIEAGTQINQTGQFQKITSSLGQQLQLKTKLETSYGYFAKFYLLYTSAFAQGLGSLTISVNGVIDRTLNSLQTMSSTLSASNRGQAQLFSKKIQIDRMQKPPVNMSQFILGLSSTSAGQFYVADFVVIQYACIKNCETCQFDRNQATTCKKCKPFYSLADNCRTCANGFFEMQDICVKCYSNCKQCRGPNSDDCLECFPGFHVPQPMYSFTCIDCLYRHSDKTNCRNSCPGLVFSDLNSNPNCTVCLSGNSTGQQSPQCKQCWRAVGLGLGACVPTSISGFIFYASDLSVGGTANDSWSGSRPTSSYQCTDQYNNLFGIAPNPNSSSPSTLTYNLKNLPTHTGLTFVFNLFKIDNWGTTSPSTSSQAANNSLRVTVEASSSSFQADTFGIDLNNAYGGNLCGGNGNQMIWTVQAELRDHTSNTLTITVRSPGEGTMVRQMEVYLANCFECPQVALSYSLFWIPMYSDNGTQTGIDTWVTFNNDLFFSNNNQNMTQEQANNLFASSYSFVYADAPVNSPILLQNRLATDKYLKYFLPVNGSQINRTLSASTSQSRLVYTRRQGVVRQMISSRQSTQVNRYIDLSTDSRRTVSQLKQFYNFFAWFALITMIVAVMLGVGVVFQQFSIMMQVIFIHIYITSQLLPATLKVPLAAAFRMQHLNYFADIPAINNQLFGELRYPSQYIFQQLNIDSYFLRSFYPILIINAIFIGWFIIFALVHCFVQPFRSSQNKFVRFLRSIPQRPLAYFDQIWRYQFLATTWACLQQFTSFVSESAQVINLVICVAAFVVTLLWPLVVVIYTYVKHNRMHVNHFRYAYHDIYYLKISSVADDPRSYLYVGVKYARILAYAVFIALFINQQIIGPVILIIVNLVQAIIAYFLTIYRDSFYLFTRVLQNLLFIVAAVLLLVIYGFSDNNDFSQASFQNIGYGVNVVFILIIINGIARFIYLIYCKVKEWSVGSYDIGQAGEKENYDYKNPIPIPQSQRQ